MWDASERAVLELVMEPALGNLKPLIVALPLNSVNESVIVREAARPPAPEVALQRFWLAGPLERRPAALFNQIIEALVYLGVVICPVLVVFPGLIVPEKLHSAAGSLDLISSCSVPRPS